MDPEEGQNQTQVIVNQPNETRANQAIETHETQADQGNEQDGRLIQADLHGRVRERDQRGAKQI